MSSKKPPNNLSEENQSSGLSAAEERINILEEIVHQQERKLALAESNLITETTENEYLKQTLTISELGYAIWDMQLDRDVAVSKVLAEIHGMGVKEYMNRVSSMEAYLALVVPEDRKKYIEYEKTFDDNIKGNTLVIDYRIKTPLGDTRHLRQMSQYIQVASGEQSQALVAIQDVSEIKRFEKELQKSREYLEEREQLLSMGATLAKMGSAVWNYCESKYESVTEEWAKIFGYTSSEFLEKFLDIESDVNTLVHPSDRERYFDYYETNDAPEIEYRIIHRNGEIRHIIQHYQRRTGIKSHTALVTIQDITERKKSEEQLIQSSKLITLGEMSTGVAHELNQPLAAIHLSAENVLRRASSDAIDVPPFITKRVERIKAQAERASSIIDHMRMFGRVAGDDFYEFDARKALAGAMSLLGEQLKLADIEICSEICDAPLLIMGHQIQLEQVLLNLLSNSFYAINHNNEENKRITVVGRKNSCKEVVLSVSDSGGGIPEEVLARIFEPFFTTKSMSEGTGLGLSVSYGIIQAMKGQIFAKNTADGTQIDMIFTGVSPA